MKKKTQLTLRDFELVDVNLQYMLLVTQVEIKPNSPKMIYAKGACMFSLRYLCLYRVYMQSVTVFLFWLLWSYYH